MGWYDHEEKDGPPAWVVTPLMWLGCLATAVLPTGAVIALWNAVLPDVPLAGRPAVYLVSLGVMVAAVKPWTIR